MCDEARELVALLLRWYGLNKRDLPWRKANNPYFVWLSEVILQQTRVDQGLPYYNNFIESFPKIEDLASASEDEVLKCWQGLGYYSRARNLHVAAKQIVSEYNVELPKSSGELVKLKGVGKYTAAAVASICYGEQVPAVDGNLNRVISRLYGIEEQPLSSKGRKVIFDLAVKLIENNDAGIVNQALMDFGSLVCVPKNPICEQCVLNNFCVAYKTGRVDELPKRKEKKEKKDRYFNYFIVNVDDHYLIQRREKKDIWQGLYEFPLVESENNLLSITNALRLINEKLEGANVYFIKTTDSLKHVLSHQNIYSRFFYFELETQKNAFDAIWVSLDSIKKLSFPKLLAPLVENL